MGDLIPGRVKVKTATTAQWETVKDNFIPMKGEVIVYSDGVNGKSAIKIGDGSRKVGLLPFLFVNAENVNYDDDMYGTEYEQDNVGDILSDIYFTKASKDELANVAFSGSADDVSYSDAIHQTSLGVSNVGDAIEYLDQAVSGADRVRYAIITMTDTENGTSNLSAQEIYTIDQQRRVWIFAFVTLGGKKVYAPLLYSANDPIDGYVAVFAYEDQGTAGYNYARIVVINKSVKVTWKNAYVATGDNISLLNNDTGFITGANVPSNETDPTVSAWAKAASKPTYTASEVGALPDTTSVPDSLAIASNVISLMAGATVLSTITLPVYSGGVS